MEVQASFQFRYDSLSSVTVFGFKAYIFFTNFYFSSLLTYYLHHNLHYSAQYNFPHLANFTMSKTQLQSLVRYLNTADTDPRRGPKLIAISPSDYRTYDNRIKTFEDFPNDSIPPTRLAEAGFIYTGNEDIVICPFCKVEGFRWLSEDNPMADHREWTPHCPFIRNNVDSTGGDSELTPDTCGLYGIEVVPNSVPGGGETRCDPRRLGIHRVVHAQYPEHFNKEVREATFDKWPKAIKQRPADLAEAGFFYTGVGDQTLCFHCGGGLKDWEENDNPWEQHALWFSKCTFLNLNKGAKFIEQVKRQHDQQPEPSTSLNGEEEQQSETKEGGDEAVAVVAEVPEEKKDDLKGEPDEKTLCKICFRNELGVVFLPCGHIVACVDCAGGLRTCAVCRKPLEATVRAFLS